MRRTTIILSSLSIVVMTTTTLLLSLVAIGCAESDYVMTNGGADTPSPKGTPRKIDFEAASPGSVPPEFIAILGDWSVDTSGPTGKNIRQKGDYHSADFPRIVMKDFSFENVHVKVRCSMQEGDDDRACGLMFRFRDSDNYYVTRANALEGNVNLYHVIGGDRVQFATAEVGVSSNDWHTLEAFAEGGHIRIRWDDKDIINADDGTFARGKVGLWTKADSVTAFDDFEATEL